MALWKEIVGENGVKTNYHRIASIKIDVGQQISVLVHSYLDEAGRDVEKLHDSDSGTPKYTAPYIVGTYVTFPYVEDITMQELYTDLKSVSPFEGAENI